MTVETPQKTKEELQRELNELVLKAVEFAVKHDISFVASQKSNDGISLAANGNHDFLMIHVVNVVKVLVDNGFNPLSIIYGIVRVLKFPRDLHQVSTDVEGFKDFMNISAKG